MLSFRANNRITRQTGGTGQRETDHVVDAGSSTRGVYASGSTHADQRADSKRSPRRDARHGRRETTLGAWQPEPIEVIVTGEPFGRPMTRTVQDHATPSDLPIAGEHAETFDAITVGLALVRDRIPFASDYPAALHIIGASLPETEDLTRAVRRLAEILLSHVITGSIDKHAERERADLLGAVNAEAARSRLRMSRPRRKAAIEDVAELLHELALETHDRYCIVDGEPDALHLLIQPASEVSASASLLVILLERGDLFMALDENLSLERAASAWYFSRWSAGTLGDEPIESGLPRAVREQEWSLVSRDTLSLDEPGVVTLVSEDERGNVPARQRALVDALQRSTVGVFEVEAADDDGPVLTVRHIADGSTYRVHEHVEAVGPELGTMLLGRLIPLGNDRWMRSEGALYIDPQDDEFRQALVNALKLVERYPTAIVVEMLISKAIYGVDVPRSPLPAATIGEARAALVEATAFLEEIGIVDPETELDARLHDDAPSIDNPALDVFGLGIDDTFAEWHLALSEQVALDDQPRRAERKRRTRKRRKRR